MDDSYPKVVSTDDRQLYPSHKLKQKLKEDYSHLKGKTLEVYYFLVKHQGKRFGVREIQRTLDYSSPSVAAYHLNRLEENELIVSTEAGEYYVEGDAIKLGKLEDHVQVAGMMIPKILFYSYHSIALVVVSLFFFVTNTDPLVWLVFIIASNAIFLLILLRDARKVASKLKIRADQP